MTGVCALILNAAAEEVIGKIKLIKNSIKKEKLIILVPLEVILFCL